MKKADRNDKWGIEAYGKEKWIQRCDYEDDKAIRKERLFAEVVKPEKMAELFALVNNLFGEDLKFSYTLDADKQRVDIKSGVDLADRPLINLAWKEFRVANFGGGLGASEPYYDKDYSKPVERVFYWMSIHYEYSHIDGGSNGASIATAWFYEDGKWTLKTDKERNR